jgi:F-type H+-transporting ATPase subunit delta
MVELVAKRYVKALMTQRDNDSLNTIYKELKTIAPAFSDDKFVSIIASTDISVDSKVELVLSFLDNSSAVVVNLIKLLGEKKRLDIIPEIVNGLNKELAVLNNSYTGIVYTNRELNSTDMDKLNGQFSKKFNVSLELSQNVCDYDGIKVDIDGLGCEIGFSKERLKSQMIDHILKAV